MKNFKMRQLSKDDIKRNTNLLEAYLTLVGEYDEEMLEEYLKRGFTSGRIYSILISNPNLLTTDLVHLLSKYKYKCRNTNQEISYLVEVPRIMKKHSGFRTRKIIMTLLDCLEISDDHLSVSLALSILSNVLAKSKEYIDSDIVERIIDIYERIPLHLRLEDTIKRLIRVTDPSSSVFERIFTKNIIETEYIETVINTLTLFNQEELPEHIVSKLLEFVQNNVDLNSKTMVISVYLDETRTIDLFKKVIKKIKSKEIDEDDFLDIISGVFDRLTEYQIKLLVDEGILSVSLLLDFLRYKFEKKGVVENAELAIRYCIRKDEDEFKDILKTYQLYDLVTCISKYKAFRKREYMKFLSDALKNRRDLKITIFKDYNYFTTLSMLEDIFRMRDFYES